MGLTNKKMGKEIEVSDSFAEECDRYAENSRDRRLVLINQSPGPMHKDIEDVARRKIIVMTPKGPSYKRGSKLERLLSWSLYGAWILRYRWRKDDKYIICSNPPVAFLAARIRGLRYTALVYDAYPMILGLRRTQGWGRTACRLLDNVLVAIQNEALANAEDIICISDEMSSLYKRVFPRHACKVRTVYPWGKSIKTNTKPSSDDASQVRITLSGNLGLTHSRENLWEIVEEAAKVASVVICTSDGGYEWAKQRQKESDCRVTIIERLDDKSYEDLMMNTDIALVPSWLSGEDCSIPSRLFTAMSYSCAVLAICSCNSSLARIVRENAIGYVYDPSTSNIATLRGWLQDVAEKRLFLKDLQSRSHAVSAAYTSANAVQVLRTMMRGHA